LRSIDQLSNRSALKKIRIAQHLKSAAMSLSCRQTAHPIKMTNHFGVICSWDMKDPALKFDWRW